MSRSEGEIMDYNICSESGCYNACIRGYVLCVNHLYGFPQKASEEACMWKHKQEKIDIEKKISRSKVIK